MIYKKIDMLMITYVVDNKNYITKEMFDARLKYLDNAYKNMGQLNSLELPLGPGGNNLVKIFLSIKNDKGKTINELIEKLKE